MRLYLDLGAYTGDTAREFRDTYPGATTFHYHLFECRPGIEVIPPEGVALVHVHRRAVWIRDGTVKFYESATRFGSSILREKKTGHLRLRKPIEIPCLCFADWLLDAARMAEYVVIKMNIEGAEYAVLRQMIDRGALGLVDELFIELHGEKVGVSEEENAALVQRMAGEGLHEGHVGLWPQFRWFTRD
jgi:FkbM family methyltransferase